MNDADDQLRRALIHRAGGPVPVAAAHDAVLARAGHVRRRRAAVAGTGALAALVVAGLVVLPRGGGDTLAPAETGESIPRVEDTETTIDVPDTTVRPTTPAEPAATTVTNPTTTTASTPGTNPSTTTDTAPATTLASNQPAPTTSGTAPPTPAPSTTSPTTAAPQPTPPTLGAFTRTYDSAGGSITVAWSGSALTLQAVNPAPGFEAEIEDQQAMRVRVRFRGEPDDARIEVRVDGGQLSVDIS